METKHTPGPWEVSANGWVEPTRGHQVLYVRYKNETVAQCWKTGSDRGLTDEQRKAETEANARLIAAVPEIPEMRELLSQAYDFFTDNGMHPANHALYVWKKRVVEIFMRLPKVEGDQQ